MIPYTRARADNSRLDYGAALWSTVRVVEQLEEAACTIRRMPGHGTRPGGHRAAWPDVVREVMDAYGYDPADEPRLAPAPGAIDRADEAVRWLLWIEGDARRLAWARANRIKWKHLARRFDRSERCLQMWHRDAILCIVERLTQNAVAVSRKPG